MTGYTVHTGASEKFVSGWDRIFGGNGSKKSKPAKKKAASKTPAADKGKARRTAKKK